MKQLRPPKVQLHKNTCKRCGRQWIDYPGGWAEVEGCPKCTSLYWSSIPLKAEF